MRKLRLDLETLRVEQFATQDEPKDRGTVEAFCGTSPGPCWTTCDPYGQNASCYITCNPYEDTCWESCCDTCRETCYETCFKPSVTDYYAVCDCYPWTIEA